MNKISPTPASITVITGDEIEVEPMIDKFFFETARFILERYDVYQHDLRILSGELAYHSEQVTNDRITYLQCNELAVAGVLETRTEFNNVHYDFFRNLSILRHLPKKNLTTKL